MSANKGPLHFSTQDKLAELSPECPNWKTLLYAVFNAELELIEAVNKCNQALTDDKKFSSHILSMEIILQTS
ncbi:MAG: hypothetical protein LVR00_01480 [Rhabdochlamydiaceae bacterium]